MITFIILLSVCDTLLAIEYDRNDTYEQEDQQKKSLENDLEGKFLEAINLIESQTSFLQDFKGNEAVFFLGETGSGKSTIFNFLMGNEIQAVKDQTKKMTSWYIDLVDKNTKTSIIGHQLDSQTSIPTIGKSYNGMLLVDFPGWEDTRGWQFDLVNQYLSVRTLENYQKIKILFICGQNYLENSRGNGLKQMISRINHFASGANISNSAMLVINKVSFENMNDESEWEEFKQLYIEDLREQFQELLNTSNIISNETKIIIKSLMKNSIYIMRKAGNQKQKYTVQEREELEGYLRQLESIPLKLKPNMTQTILNQFNQYFTFELNKVKERVKYISKNILEVFKTTIQQSQNSSQNDMLLAINQEVEWFQFKLNQIPFNQLMRYDALEQVYLKIMKLVNKTIDLPSNYINIAKIYNYFYPLRQHIAAYLLQIFDDDILNELFSEQIRFQEILKEKQIISQQAFEKMSEAMASLIKQNQEMIEELRRQQLEEKKRKGALLRFLTNEERAWWKFWKPNKIPNDVKDEDVEDWIASGR